jgi:hypothetical protein
MPLIHRPDPEYALRQALECARFGRKPSRYIMKRMSLGDRLDYQKAKKEYERRNDAFKVDPLRKRALEMLAERDAEAKANENE